MYITRRWLNKFIDITSVKDEEITIALNSLGFEVDAYKNYQGLNDNLVIGQLGSVNPIEGTHLNFCFVDLGEDLPSAIVCGADNVVEGQFVLVATPGTKIANGLTIANREIRGKSSEGMICALTEIGLEPAKLAESESDSIYVVHTKEETHTYLGDKNALDIIGFNDAVWDVDLTLNRSDALAALQIAKELANYFGVSKSGFKIFDEKIYGYQPTTKTTIKMAADIKKHVQSLSTAVVQKKQIIAIDKNWTDRIYAEDDIWLRNSGAKPTGNFYHDLANMIALESGQPVIFIDPAKIKTGLEICNRPDEKNAVGLKLMDGDEIVATFGVQWNENYMPTKDSKEILAIFPSLDPIFMRKQQKAYNLSTVAMQRYMKPISSQLYGQTYERMVQIFDHYELLSRVSDLEIIKDSNEKAAVVNVSEAYLQNILGITLKPKEIIALFSELDFEVTHQNGNFEFIVDSNRTDISLPADIAEEVARLYGYDNIKPEPLNLTSIMKSSKIERNVRNQIEGFLSGHGFANVKTYSLLPHATVDKWDLFGYQNPVDLAMPLSQMRETYRLSMLPSIIDTIILNSNKGNKNIKIYEFADVYNLNNVRERHLGIGLSGDILDSKAHKVALKIDWFFVKGIIESILERYNINLNEVSFKNLAQPLDEMHPYINAAISYRGETLGFITKLNPQFEQSNKITPTFVADLSVSALERLANKNIRWTEFSKFQRTSRDISVVLQDGNEYSNIISEITKDVKYLENIQLSDIYVDEELQKNKQKSITITFIFNDNQSQLTDQMVNDEFNKILAKIKAKGIVIR
jgi:phenylalanyl-tRNA synthetase beta chain